MTQNTDPSAIHIEIAAPCKASWDEMIGDNQTRFCESCEKNVHNLSAMSEAQVRELIAGKDPVCVRFFRREDGTVMTENCPKGLAAVRAKMLKVAAVVAGLLVTTFALPIRALAGDAAQPCSRGSKVLMGKPEMPVSTVHQGNVVVGGMLPPPVKPDTVTDPPESPIMGEIAVPTNPPPPEVTPQPPVLSPPSQPVESPAPAMTPELGKLAIPRED